MHARYRFDVRTLVGYSGYTKLSKISRICFAHERFSHSALRGRLLLICSAPRTISFINKSETRELSVSILFVMNFHLYLPIDFPPILLILLADLSREFLSQLVPR